VLVLVLMEVSARVRGLLPAVSGWECSGPSPWRWVWAVPGPGPRPPAWPPHTTRRRRGAVIDIVHEPVPVLLDHVPAHRGEVRLLDVAG